MKSTNTGDGEEFDFSAKHCNVTEISAKSNDPSLLASEKPVQNEDEHESTTTLVSKSN